jgi:hypothetical protein
MKLSIFLFATLVFFSLFQTSCAPAYVPNVINTPMLSNQGEFQAGIYSGTSGFDLLLSYALTDHLGIMANGSFQNTNEENTVEYHRHAFVEFAPGYYTNMGDAGRFEVWGGYGFGSLEANYNDGTWSNFSKVNSSRIFLQPSIGATTRYFDASIATRFVFLNLYQEDLSHSAAFWEPVFTGKVGYQSIKGVIQMGMSLPFDDEGVDFYYQPFITSIGLQLDLGRIYNNPD